MESQQFLWKRLNFFEIEFSWIFLSQTFGGNIPMVDGCSWKKNQVRQLFEREDLEEQLQGTMEDNKKPLVV